MRRIYALLAAALVVGMLPLATSAGAVDRSSNARSERVVSSKVRQPAKQVKRYWTKERMRTAIPLDLTAGRGARAAEGDAAATSQGRPGSFAPTAPVARPARTTATMQALGPYPYYRYEVTSPYTSYPYSTHGKVFFTNDGVNYVCSGTAVNSENKSIVWTAGHCVHGGGSWETWHYNWAFVPAYKDGSRPFGTWSARELWSLGGWVNNADLSYDLGAAVVYTNSSGQRLVDVVGGRGITWNQSRDQYFYAFGYPAAYPFNGQRLIVCESWWWANDYPGSGPATMAIGCDMTGGSSGGGWIVNGYTHSVNSYKYNNEPEVMYGPYHGDAAANLYNAVRNR